MGDTPGVLYSDGVVGLRMFKIPLLSGVLFLLALTHPLPAVATDPPILTAAKHSKARIVFDRSYVQPSESAPVGNLGILIELDPGWHTYWEYSGEAAKPAAIKWVLPEGFALGGAQWPVPLKIRERGNLMVYGYEGSALVKWPVELADINYLKGRASAGVSVKARLNLLVCKDTCVPEQHDLERELTVSTSNAIGESADSPIFASFKNQYPSPLPDTVQVTANANGTIVNISELIAKSAVPMELLAKIQFFPKPSLPVPQLRSAQLVKLSVKTGSEEKFGVLQPVPQGTDSRIGGVLAISRDVTRDGRELIFEVPSTAKSGSSDSAEAVSTEHGELLYKIHEITDPVVSIHHRPVEEFSLYILLLAFIGGLILNLMPCVLPVLSIKVFSIVECVRHGQRLLPNSLAYTSGVVSSFGVLALLVAALKAAGHSVGWGFQFQNLYFLYFMVGAVFLFSLSLMGGYGFAAPLSNELNDQCNRTSHPLVKSFLEGVLATLLSTPCSAPVVATVLAFALTSSLQYSLPIFLTMGLGLASPLLLLSVLPSFAKFIPKPGMWMIRFRQFLAIILMGTVVWLLDVIQTINADAVPYALYLLFVLTVFAWLFVSTERSVRKIVLLVLALLAFYYFAGKASKLSPASRSDAVTNSPSKIAWQAYDKETIRSTLDSGHPAFVVFTAAWCLTCKYNERFIINTPTIMAALKSTNSAAYKADWTDGNGEITAAIQSYGAEGVPLYVVIHPAKAPIILSTLPSKQEIIDALENK